jgi:hypothetical protein
VACIQLVADSLENAMRFGMRARQKNAALTPEYLAIRGRKKY